MTAPDKYYSALYYLALVCAVTPLVTVHLTWIIATLSGALSPCLPYWADCHSISATGRYFPANLLFKGIFIPLAFIMAVYWWQLHRWLVLLSDGRCKPRVITFMGLTACIALTVYTMTLGVEAGPFPLARRIGAVLYFAFTSFAHLVLILHIQRADISEYGLDEEVAYLTRTCGVLVIAAIISALLGFFWDGWGHWENAFEWAFSIMMISLFYWVGRMWKKTNIRFGWSVCR